MADAQDDINAQEAPAAEAAKTPAPAPAPATKDPVAAATKPYLTTRPSDDFGPTGHFHDLTADQFAAAEKADPGLLVEPDESQLALRH